MSLLEKFLDKISSLLTSSKDKQRLALAYLNPNRIDVENVRTAMGISYQSAVEFCEAAVRQGKFQRKIEIRCPDGSVAKTVNSEDDLPIKVHCYSTDGSYDDEYLPTAALEKHLFYVLKANATR